MERSSNPSETNSASDANQSFDDFFKSSFVMLYDAAVRRNVPPQDAEEIAQESLTELLRKTKEVAIEDPTKYRWGIFKNLMKGYWRKLFTRMEISFEDMDTIPHPHSPDDEFDVTSSDFLYEILDQIRRNDPSDAVAEGARYLADKLVGMRVRDIAKKYDVPDGTVKGRMASARNALRKRLITTN